MLSGQAVQIRSITGIRLDKTASVVCMPTGEVIKVLSGPNGNGQLHDKGLDYVLCEAQTIALVAVDFGTRGAN